MYKVKVAQSCLTLCDPTDNTSPWNSPGQNTGVGSLSLLQGILPTQGSKPGLPHCRQILYQLSHKGHSGILEWVAYPFSSESSRPRNRHGVSCIAGGFFINSAMREAPILVRFLINFQKMKCSRVFSRTSCCVGKFLLQMRGPSSPALLSFSDGWASAHWILHFLSPYCF